MKVIDRPALTQKAFFHITSGERRVDVLHSGQSRTASPAILAYELYVHDARYSVPTFHLLSTVLEDEARRVALACLAETPHHRRVELWRGKSLVAAWGRDDLAGR